MADQAETLRKLAAAETGLLRSRLEHTRLIAVASGKGGVGKSNVSLNFALALQAQGSRVAIIDGDLGFSNLEILLGMRPQYSLQDVFRGQVDLRDAFTLYRDGLTLISGGSGLVPEERVANIYMARFAQQLMEVDGVFDYLLIDFGAGFGRFTSEMMALCDELLLVTTPEPTSLTDAYALVKMMTKGGRLPRLRLVVNRARTSRQAQEASDKFRAVAGKFLDLQMESLGFVLEDEAVGRAVLRQLPFILGEPHAVASRCVNALAETAWPEAAAQDLRAFSVVQPARGIRAFFERFGVRR